MNVIDTAGPWEVFQDVGAETGGSSPFRQFESSFAQVEFVRGGRFVEHDDVPRPPASPPASISRFASSSVTSAGAKPPRRARYMEHESAR